MDFSFKDLELLYKNGKYHEALQLIDTVEKEDLSTKLWCAWIYEELGKFSLVESSFSQLIEQAKDGELEAKIALALDLRIMARRGDKKKKEEIPLDLHFTGEFGFWDAMIELERARLMNKRLEADRVFNILSTLLELTDDTFIQAHVALISAETNYYQSEYELAVKNANLSFDIFDTIGYPKGKADSQDLLARISYERGNLERMHEYVNQAIKLRERIKNPLYTIRSLIILAYYYFGKGEYQKSLEISRNTMLLLLKLDHKVELARNYQLIALIYHNIGQFEKSQIFVQKAMDIGDQYRTELDQANVMQIAGNNYVRMRKYKEAIYFHKRAYDMLREIGTPIELAQISYNLGTNYEAKGEIENALDFFLKCHRISEKIGHKMGMGYASNGIGGIYYHKGELDQALDYFRRSIELADITGNEHISSDSFHYMGLCYEDMGDYVKSLEYYQKSVEIHREITQIDRIRTNLLRILEVSYILNDESRINDIRQIIIQQIREKEEENGLLEVFLLYTQGLLGKLVSMDISNTEHIFKKIVMKDEDDDINFNSYRHLIELYMNSISKYQDRLIHRWKDIEYNIRKMEELAQKNQLIRDQIYITVLEAKLQHIMGETELARTLTEKATSICEKNKMKELVKKIQKEIDWMALGVDQNLPVSEFNWGQLIERSNIKEFLKQGKII